MHLYFRDVRVHKRKEFFAASEDDVHRLFDFLTQEAPPPASEEEEVDDHDETTKALWTHALAKAGGGKKKRFGDGAQRQTQQTLA